MAQYDFIHNGVRHIGPLPRETGDYLHHNYQPVDPAQAHQWATLKAQAAFFACAPAIVPSIATAVVLTWHKWIVPTDAWYDAVGKLALAFIVGILFPFVWPFRRPWVSPIREYHDAIEKYEAWRDDYDDVAIKRLEMPTVARQTVQVERTERDKIEELYRQCAIALLILKYGTELPRDATTKVIRDIEGMTVKLDKHNVKTVMSLLCEFKMTHGGNGEKYVLTDEYKDMTDKELFAELRSRKHLIKPKRSTNRNDSPSWQ